MCLRDSSSSSSSSSSSEDVAREQTGRSLTVCPWTSSISRLLDLQAHRYPKPESSMPGPDCFMFSGVAEVGSHDDHLAVGRT
eukprot:1706482-Alexandrium_andersonii.AAC.1